MELSLFGYTVAVDGACVGASVAKVCRQAAAYERGERLESDLDIAFSDDFTGRVIRAMTAITPGETRTYGDLAAEIDTGPVAVGGACGRNPVPLVVPCHGVVAADGLGGFSADDGVESKRVLLVHEREYTGDERQASLVAYGR